jgi:hypothetical protein
LGDLPLHLSSSMMRSPLGTNAQSSASIGRCQCDITVRFFRLSTVTAEPGMEGLTNHDVESSVDVEGPVLHLPPPFEDRELGEKCEGVRVIEFEEHIQCQAACYVEQCGRTGSRRPVPARLSVNKPRGEGRLP